LSRTLIAWIIASTIVTASVGASAQTNAAAATPVKTVVTKNEPPLKAGGPAGIRAAQGASDRGVLIASGLILTAIVAALLLTQEDDDDTVSTGSTN